MKNDGGLGEKRIWVHGKSELDHCSPCTNDLDLQHSQPPAWHGTARWTDGGYQGPSSPWRRTGLIRSASLEIFRHLELRNRSESEPGLETLTD